MKSQKKNRISVRILLAAATVALLLSCLALIALADGEVSYVYFDLAAGNVTISGANYNGFAYQKQTDGTFVKVQISGTLADNEVYYIYQSIGGESDPDGYFEDAGDGNRIFTIPTRTPVKIGDKAWSEYITNNTDVNGVITAWRDSSGRQSTPYRIAVSGTVNCKMVVDNVFSSYLTNGSSDRGRTDGGLSFVPSGKSTLTVVFYGENRFSNIYYGTDASSSASQIIFTAQDENDSVTVANLSPNANHNFWCSAIGASDSGRENAQGIVIQDGVVWAGTTSGDDCTAIGAGGNGYGVVTIQGGTVTAVTSSSGTAIGGGIGKTSPGGAADVTITGGTVYAYNFSCLSGYSQHGVSYIPAAAIGGGSSAREVCKESTVTITGGRVYAQSVGGTAIGGGSSADNNGGASNVTIGGNAYVEAKSISGKIGSYDVPAGVAIGGGTGGKAANKNGGNVTLTIKENAIVRAGSIGGGKTISSTGTIGAATVNITGGNVSGQVIMAGGSSTKCSFAMSGGLFNNSDRNEEEFPFLEENGGAIFMDDQKGTATISGGTIKGSSAVNGGAIYMTAGIVTIKDTSVIQNCSSAQDGGAIYLGGGTVTMSGGTIQNCSTEKLGGAIYVTGGSVEMSGGTIQNCSAATGGGVYVDGGNFSMSGGVLQNNVATANGGGVYVNGGNFSISGGTIGAQDAPNQAQNGAGAYVNGGNVNITGGNLQYNAASSLGGGVYLTGGEFTLNGESASINNNTATNGGGVYLLANPILLAGSITENTATANCGGICIDKTEVSLAPTGQVTISQNKATNGAGIYIGGTEESLAAFSVSSDCTGEVLFDGNVATENGGGACLSYGNFNINSDKILLYGNQAANGGGVAVLNGSFALSAGAVGVIEEVANSATNGGGVYVNGGNVTVTGGNIENNTATSGGGVYLTGGAFTLNGDGASINNNTATNGGGVYLTQINPTLLAGSITENTATANGGGIFIEQQIVELKPTGAVLITDNSAQNGAGLYINGTTENDDAGFSVDDSDGGTVTLTGNTASANGGGVYVNNGFFTMDTDHLILQKNGAVDGGAVYVNGGNATLSNGTVDQNTASQNGGGIYVNGGSVELSGATVTGNTATQNGGGIAVSNGNVTMLGGKVDRNHAVNGSGGGIYVTTTGNTTVTIQSGSISYNQNNIYGGALAVYGGVSGKIEVKIGLNENHYDENGTLVGCDHYENGSTNLDCPVIKDNTVANEGGAIYIKGGSTTVLGIYCIIESGNRAGGISAGDEEETTLSDFMMVEGGTVEISSADSQAGGSTYGYGHGVIEGSIHVKAGKVDLWGSMLNPFIEAPITVDIEGKNDYFKDHRQNEEGKIKWYKIHYYENFEKNGVTTGRYTAYSVSSADEYHIIEAVNYAHTGYTILGWCTLADPTEEQLQEYLYATGSLLEVAKIPTLPGYSVDKETLFLYAQWSSNAYYIQFDPNTSAYTGSMENQTLSCTSEAVLKENQYLRELYVFLGWGTTKDQTNPTYFDKALIDPLSSEDGDVVILYAIWGSCTHEEMEITSLEGEVTTHNPTLAYSAEGATLTVTCSCQYCESATLHAENAIYDGNPHTASVTYTHGVLLKDLKIGYVYALPAGVDLSDDEAKNHGECRYAGTYTAAIETGGKTASLTYVIERAPQAAPDKPTYEIFGDTLTVNEISSAHDNVSAHYRLVYYNGDSKMESAWGTGREFAFVSAWTTYYVEVYYPASRNYYASEIIPSVQRVFYTGYVTVEFDADKGIKITVDKQDGLKVMLAATEGYYLTTTAGMVESVLKGSTPDDTIKSQIVITKVDNQTFTVSQIPNGSEAEIIAIKLYFTGVAKKATASAMVKPGEVFSAITSTVETKIARDSAFTVNFRIEDYANYSNLTLTFGEQSLPIGTTVILKDLTDGTYWWMKLESPSQSIPLTSFQKMGTDETFADPTATTLHYQFVIDFSDVTGGCAGEALTVSLKATPSGNAPELKPSANVTLKAISFSVEKQTEEDDTQESVRVTFAQTDGTASKWDGLTGYLLLTPTGEQNLPPDLVLRVTQGNATALYQRNAKGCFAVKLTNGESNLTLSLESEMFPDAGATYSFSATLHATAVHDAPRSDVIAELTEDLTFKIPAKAAEPMAKLTGTQRVVTLGGTLTLTPAVSYDKEGYDCVIKIQYKSGNGYEDTSLQVTDWESGEEQEINLASIRTEGSYRVVAVISQKGTGTTVLAVPYYFVIE